jgi:hypothetical protein
MYSSKSLVRDKKMPAQVVGRFENEMANTTFDPPGAALKGAV